MEKELLSAYMDGEQVDARLTEALIQDDGLRQSWETFHTIRSVMRKESSVFLGADFTAKMAELIEQETIERQEIEVSQPTAEESAQLPFVQKLKVLFAPISQIAVAASVCLAVVLGVQSYIAKTNINQAPEIPILQTLPFNNSVQEVSYNAPTKEITDMNQVEQKNRRISEMLQNYELQRRMHADTLSIDSN
ncbi:sigma-E factor negative regulatory protein [Rodentibacter caecimuris]|uniref:Anti-sigma-E factor RseA n=1 Tax=Rodentibacter caecimuris TaxID=1796644 RepID=A0ABX3KWW6_9PAST|nr:transcriptional regulator [Rodentibacter heylii]